MNVKITFLYSVSLQTFSNAVVTRDEFEPGSAIDGTKFICLDELYKDLIRQRCLIYSFGLSYDWTFEENMADFGCKVTSVNIEILCDIKYKF